MPVGFTASYTHLYDLGGTPPTGSTVYPGAPSPHAFDSEFSDTEDGNDDGNIAVGQQMFWDAVSEPVTLVGLTSNGDPVILDSFGNYSIASNNASLSGNIGFTTASGFVMCFHKGTRIETPAGQVNVEDLKIGDLVTTATGAAVPVKWLGRQTVSTRFGAAERMQPVRISAGALGGGQPNTDLTVTADHAVLIDGVLCNAGALVNGTTITRVPLAEMGERYTVYHIETEGHEIILANGAPAETFIDNVSRRAFDNYSEFEALYGDVPEMEELPLPRAMSTRQVPAAIQARLGRKSAA